MIAALIFLAIVVAIAGWWLSRQRLFSKPWLETGNAGLAPGTEAINQPASKVGLGVFLAVVGALFALFFSAYFMRMEFPDWRTLAMPRIVWFNTGALVLSSIALQMAVVAARRGRLQALRQDLLAGAAAAVIFLVGQVLAWRALAELGYFATSNPAYSFFVLITGVHGLHMIGGLIALARTAVQSAGGEVTERLRTGTELCATYWHFMLLVWVIIVALLAGWLNEFADICRQLLV
ncbi:cytochrome c oxidase subunit 3 [Nitratireductor sp. XY-223]|uniref:cytochrome c oxidase subunit 3 n=1 Tax=Nitratireductor sp. XY-223 TaxID=2561926 RepID=UPI0010AA868F|nr:cytochrome c oxidase subunit 3 [Nitratireductor sp. XY-223]